MTAKASSSGIWLAIEGMRLSSVILIRCHSTLRPTEIRMVRTGAGAVAVTRLVEEPGPLQGSGRGTDLEAEGDFHEQDLHR